jgi:hypothetical protein
VGLYIHRQASYFQIHIYGRNVDKQLKEEYRLRVFENRVLRIICGPRMKQWEAGEHCVMRSFITCMLNQLLLRLSYQGG